MFNKLLKFIIAYAIFLTIIIFNLEFNIFIASNFGNITRKECVNVLDKYDSEICTIYCDKHGCKHNHKLEKYHWIFQKYDVPMTNFTKYRDINLLIYLLLIPLLIFLALYLK